MRKENEISGSTNEETRKFHSLRFLLLHGSLASDVLVSHLHPPQLLVRDRQDLSRRIISTTSVYEVVVDLQHEIRVLQALLGIFETTPFTMKSVRDNTVVNSARHVLLRLGMAKLRN